MSSYHEQFQYMYNNYSIQIQHIKIFLKTQFSFDLLMLNMPGT